MKFKGHGVVWDKSKGKPLIKFGKEKIIDISDEYIIDTLIELGYRPDREFIEADYKEVEEPIEEVEEVEEIVEEPREETYDIRLKAKELGIKNWHNKKLDKLEKEISELEGA